MGEHRTVDDLVARVTNQAIEIESLRGKVRSLKAERDHWIAVANERGDALAAEGRKTVLSPREQMELALGVEWIRQHQEELFEYKPVLDRLTDEDIAKLRERLPEYGQLVPITRDSFGCQIVDPSPEPEKLSWWRRVFCSTARRTAK